MADNFVDLGIPGIDQAVVVARSTGATVYRAQQSDYDRTVAVKVIDRAAGYSERQFDRERRALGRLTEIDGIVTVYESGLTDAGDPFIVMEYMVGGSVAEEIEQHGPMPWDRAVGIISSVGRALHRGHDEGVFHRDVKPGNMLIDAHGNAVLTDYGIARLDLETMSMTDMSTSLTPAYSSPEAFENVAPTAAADVYSAAATLWSLIVARPPFTDPGGGTSLEELMGRVATRDAGDLRGLAPDAVCEVIEQAMSKDPADRYESAGAFADALAAARDASAGFKPAVEPGDVSGWREQVAPGWRARLSSPRVLAVAALVVLAVVAGVVLLAIRDDGDGDLASPDMSVEVNGTSAHVRFIHDECVNASWSWRATDGSHEDAHATDDYPDASKECHEDNNLKPGEWQAALFPGKTYVVDVTIVDKQGRVADGSISFDTPGDVIAVPILEVTEGAEFGHYTVGFEHENCVAARWTWFAWDEADDQIIETDGYPDASVSCDHAHTIEFGDGDDQPAFLPGKFYVIGVEVTDADGRVASVETGVDLLEA